MWLHVVVVRLFTQRLWATAVDKYSEVRYRCCVCTVLVLVSNVTKATMVKLSIYRLTLCYLVLT